MSHGHHQPYDPYYQLPPAPAAAPGGEWNSGINTLFVSGLPDDVKAREIHNIFRRRPGFDSCQLKYTGRGNQVVAFATFFNHQSAIAALHSLNGVKFDPQSGSTLHIELARSNSRRKRKPGSGAYVVIDKRTKKPSDAHETSSDDVESDPEEDPEMNNVNTAYQGGSENAKSEATSDPDNAAVAVNIGERTAEGGVRPCSTLFIANLGPNCTEDELKQVLSQYPGFHVLKIRAKGGMPVAFADFEEIEQATKVMENLQETTLPSSDRGGMHIEYARSKMRKP
ncbi:PREDICTED: U2 small nuclear ribonucleoprotein B'' isoform X2 [Populus euphratica]|uniref:U2 small nuclear ribonucleoprotein B'' isoform X2 n=1 Tax=Populus euphratica TaxID=75702 RepID=A0AAJ6TA74_POPEU|nr:PREDICTED: U2 small nuclear ribonucleoprotein B'' isoform X2 [Populus euphratica]